MKYSLKTWQILGFIFAGILGVILHFLYEWTGESVLVAPFSAVNESTFEHMKLLFFPMFVFAIIQNHFMGGDPHNFWCIKLTGTLCGVLTVPVLFYTLSGTLGPLPGPVNIAIFFISAAIGYLLEFYLFSKKDKKCKSSENAFLTLCLLAVIFATLTFSPLQIPLFLDPLSGTYGI